MGFWWKWLWWIGFWWKWLRWMRVLVEMAWVDTVLVALVEKEKVALAEMERAVTAEHTHTSHRSKSFQMDIYVHNSHNGKG
ncbi:unnamed protein product [Coffea canephora]|uniref:Uncharacterized protein n=1 Tax=Coffea canephora TaxID=49390 RepID=A0A068VAY2_COFCA|nr:unnamed protein product [Coffea canephora]